LKTLTTIFFIFTFAYTFSQDFIILKSGDEIKAKVLETKDEYIVYRIYDDLLAGTNSILKSEVLLIKFNDGTIVVFDNQKIISDTTYLQLTEQEIKDKAVADANIYYKTAEPVTFAVCSSLGCPYIGMIPALLVASEAPKIENYNFPTEYASNETYIYYYGREAYRLKQKRVIMATFIASTPYLIILIISLM